MTLKEWLMIKFNSRNIVCLVIQQKDHKLVRYYRKQENGVIDIEGHSYIMDEGRYYFTKNIPTYFYREGDPQPIDLHKDFNIHNEGKWELVEPRMSTTQFSTGMKAHVLRDLFNTFESKIKLQTVVIIGVVVILAALAASTWFLLDTIQNMQMELSQLRDMIRAIAGGGE